MRLAGGWTNAVGRLEILYNGTWGTVGSYLWNEVNAVVACRQLGYNNGGLVSPKRGFLSDASTIWLAGAMCIGTESWLADCPHGGWGMPLSAFAFTHAYDVELECFNAPIPPIPPSPPKPSGPSGMAYELELCYHKVQ